MKFFKIENKKISIKILAREKDKLAIKLPFLDIPVIMDYDFFNKRLATGYFQLVENDRDDNTFSCCAVVSN